jgi:hypothetical protein
MNLISHGDPVGAQKIVRLPDGELAKMENRRRQHRLGVAVGDPFVKML